MRVHSQKATKVTKNTGSSLFCRHSLPSLPSVKIFARSHFMDTPGHWAGDTKSPVERAKLSEPAPTESAGESGVRPTACTIVAVGIAHGPRPPIPSP